LGPHPDDVPDGEIVEVAARAIEQMIQDVRSLTLERDQLLAEAQQRPLRRSLRRTAGVAGRLRTRVERVVLR
jgi:hypothetical protein